jgi:mediator of RNA polymerase II transcription subunit 21
LVSRLPGLDHSEREQEERIKQLEIELKAAEEKRKTAVGEKDAVLEKLEAVIRSVKRP